VAFSQVRGKYVDIAAGYKDKPKWCDPRGYGFTPSFIAIATTAARTPSGSMPRALMERMAAPDMLARDAVRLEKGALAADHERSSPSSRRSLTL
jgi:hypothetical protein